jgi:hypothetical protein
MVSDADLEELMDLFVGIANGIPNLEPVLTEYHDRSLAIKVYDSNFTKGIMFERGKIRLLQSLDRPTVTVTTNKDTFWDIVNSDNSEIQQKLIFVSLFTTRTLEVNCSDQDVMFHLLNVNKIFKAIMEMSGGA